MELDLALRRGRSVIQPAGQEDFVHQAVQFGDIGLALGLSGAFALSLRRERPADPRPTPKEET